MGGVYRIGPMLARSQPRLVWGGVAGDLAELRRGCVRSHAHGTAQARRAPQQRRRAGPEGGPDWHSKQSGTHGYTRMYSPTNLFLQRNVYMLAVSASLDVEQALVGARARAETPADTKCRGGADVSSAPEQEAKNGGAAGSQRHRRRAEQRPCGDQASQGRAASAPQRGAAPLRRSR